MVMTQTATGLCTTCEGALTCTFPKYEGQPVIFCEEFEGFKRNGHVEDVDVEAILAGVNVQPRSRKGKVYKGLCSNCEIREACTFPKAEGGIWHCEEYR
jgi:hypothetical protein